MKGRQVVLGQVNGTEAAALMVDGRLEDVLIDPSALVALAPGAILRGIVDRPVKGQGGVFLRLPGGESGFLRDRGGLAQGQPLLVQVAAVAEAGKAVPLTARLLFRGRYGIVTPEAPGVNVSRRIRDEGLREALVRLGTGALAGQAPDMGMVIRSAATLADEAEVAAELAELVALAAAVTADAAGAPELLVDAPSPWDSAWRDWADPAPDAVLEGATAFRDSGAEDALAALASPVVDLGGGASAVIEPTRALVAIDVNTGRDTTPAAALKANIALARDLPRQLRLRGLGGQVVIDFAPMPKRDRGTLEQVLRAAFKGEGAETVLSGWTGMGLYELSRKRDRAPLARLLGALG